MMTIDQSPSALVDPQVLMRIRNLELRARVVVEGFWNGIHRSPYHGFSVEFTEYRQYAPGDDPRDLDWRVFARSDRYYVKRFQDETNLRCHLLVDCSRSMSYGSLAYTKSEYAATLAATLAYFLHLQGDAVGLLTFDDQLVDFLPARHRTGHLRQLMQRLDKPATGRGTNLASPLQRLGEMIRKRGLVVLISDFLAPLEPLETALTHLTAFGHEVILFQILDPAEVTFAFPQPAFFEDAESQKILLLDPDTVRTEYQRKLQAHGTAVREICQNQGISFASLQTQQPMEYALFDFLRAQMSRRRPSRRHAQPITPPSLNA